MKESSLNIPRHIAVIMDGNGRWAKARGLSRIEGHRKGADAVRATLEAARDLGVRYLTLFSFSSENWSRPPDEITGLMGLLRVYLKKETAALHAQGVRLLVIGDRSRLPEDIVGLITQAENITRDNDKITLVIALSYGGRQDILFAAKELARRAKQGTIDPDGIGEDVFSSFLMTAGIPDPDLMIRTSGESRISNFLLWQLSYAELFFTDTLWPDFSKQDMEEAVAFHAARDRRYGGRPKEAEQG